MFPLRNLKRDINIMKDKPIGVPRMIIKRLQAEFNYIFKPEEAPLPETINFFITHRCNHRCDKCNVLAYENITKRGELKPDIDLKNMGLIIEDLSTFKPNIVLSGGEPLLHKHIFKIISKIKSAGMYCSMVTNGTLLERYASELVRSNIDRIHVYLDGTSLVHDEVRGVEGLFDTISQGVSSIVELRKKKPQINIRTMVMPHNYKELDQMFDVLQEMGADAVTFHHLIYNEKEAYRNITDKYKFLDPEQPFNLTDDHGVDPEEVAKTVERINNIKSRYKVDVDFIPHINGSEILKYYSDFSWFPAAYSHRCQSAWLRTYIFPDSQVSPCLNFKYSFGYLNINRFKDLWNGREARAYRKLLKKEKYLPVCNRCGEIFNY